MINMRLVLPLLLLFFEVHYASASRHSLIYFYTAVSGDIDFPEFTAVGLVDGVQFMYFDSYTQKAVPKTDWIRQNEEADYWNRETQILLGQHQDFKSNIQTAKERFNLTESSGVHTWQGMYGCELDDETGQTYGFEQYGYDGKDFISLDVRNIRWVAPVQQAVITKQKWDNDKAQLVYERQYLTQTCIDWLIQYLHYGRSILERTVSPEVYLLQKSSSSSVECLATGFYPRQALISWQKNGQDLNEDVELLETLPNEDGTFQKRSRLTVSAKALTEHQYSCVVDHKSLPDRTVKTWEPADNNSGVIIGIVVAVIVLVAVIAGVGLFIRSKSGPSSAASVGSNDSDVPILTGKLAASLLNPNEEQHQQ
ncbi:major histocompatibility complex class I-related gene protein-like [Chanos chanos]|uniref:Major histocompatibility complex class I-related gene protein-like n=1 Tax=Chanos chanos TaxID=29144 RepID=A0A6J2VYY9_CHACN|nr:major histocompatibility complex class I-related gene protein-like [Chanos chanos]